jgi:hypothetical protein
MPQEFGPKPPRTCTSIAGIIPESFSLFVGKKYEKFTNIETGLRTGRNAAKNRSYSPGMLDAYKIYFNAHIKDEPFTLHPPPSSLSSQALESHTNTW